MHKYILKGLFIYIYIGGFLLNYHYELYKSDKTFLIFIFYIRINEKFLKTVKKNNILFHFKYEKN